MRNWAAKNRFSFAKTRAWLRRGLRRTHPGIEIPPGAQSGEAHRKRPGGPATFAGQSPKVCPAADFRRAKRKSPPGRRTLAEQSAEVCPAAARVTFARQSAEVCLARAFSPAGFFARFFAAAGPGKTASYKREAAYRKRRKKYATSYLDFRPPRSDLCAAGPKTGSAPGRAGKAAAG